MIMEHPEPKIGQVWWNHMTRAYYVVYKVEGVVVTTVRIAPEAAPWAVIRRATWKTGVPLHYICQYNPKD